MYIGMLMTFHCTWNQRMYTPDSNSITMIGSHSATHSTTDFCIYPIVTGPTSKQSTIIPTTYRQACGTCEDVAHLQ